MYQVVRQKQMFEAMLVSDAIACIDKKDFTGAMPGLENVYKTGGIGSNVDSKGPFLMITDGDRELFSRNANDWLFYDAILEALFFVGQDAFSVDYEVVVKIGS